MAGRIVRGVLLLLALAVALAPFVILFLNSIRPADAFLSETAPLLPDPPTLAHYREILDPEAGTLRYLANSLIVAAATTLLSLLLGAPAAYALARLRLPFRLSHLVALSFLVVRFYPKITIALPFFLLMRHLHLLDTHAAIVIAHVSLAVPFVVWLLLAFFEDFPRELEQAAMLDGCGPLRRFVQVVLPLMAPVLVTAAILTAILSWNEFLMASAVGPVNAKTLPVRVSGFITDKGASTYI